MQEKRRNIDPEDEPPEKENRVALSAVGEFDGDLYTGGKSKFDGYHTTLAVDDHEVIYTYYSSRLQVINKLEKSSCNSYLDNFNYIFPG